MPDSLYTTAPSELARQRGHEAPEELQAYVDAYSQGFKVGSIAAAYHITLEKHYQATHDKLTGLPNRAGFFEVGSMVLDNLADWESAVVYLADANGLKHINDTRGHKAGDEYLIGLAYELSDKTRRGVVARLGGDEFVVLSIVSPEEGVSLDEMANWQMAILRETGNLAVGRSSVLSKQALSLIDKNEALGSLLGEADEAMYDHKKRARSR